MDDKALEITELRAVLNMVADKVPIDTMDEQTTSALYTTVYRAEPEIPGNLWDALVVETENGMLAVYENHRGIHIVEASRDEGGRLYQTTHQVFGMHLIFTRQECARLAYVLALTARHD